MATGPYYSSLLFNKANPFGSELESHFQQLQNVATATLHGLTLCLVWNAGSVAFLWMLGGVEAKIMFLAIAYLVCGLPAAYWSWYHPLCQALRTENGSMFGRFFLFFQLHVAFCIFAAVSPPGIAKGLSLTGILSAIDVSENYAEFGYLYFLGAGLFTIESTLSIWALQKVHMLHRRLVGSDLEMV